MIATLLGTLDSPLGLTAGLALLSVLALLFVYWLTNKASAASARAQEDTAVAKAAVQSLQREQAMIEALSKSPRTETELAARLKDGSA